MSRDILSEYGNDSGAAEVGRATNGGRQMPKELSYDPPKGPKGQSHNTVGLGGDNCGTCGTQGKH